VRLGRDRVDVAGRYGVELRRGVLLRDEGDPSALATALAGIDRLGNSLLLRARGNEG
jgi:hypothetical protein